MTFNTPPLQIHRLIAKRGTHSIATPTKPSVVDRSQEWAALSVDGKSAPMGKEEDKKEGDIPDLPESVWRKAQAFGMDGLNGREARGASSRSDLGLCARRKCDQIDERKGDPGRSEGEGRNR